MKVLVLISAICLQLGWSHAKGHSNGVGAFTYEDSTGKRYGGTYGLKDGEVVDAKGSFPPDFSPPTEFSPPTDFLLPNFDEPDNFIGFFPEYFRNLENLLQDPEFTYYAPTPQIPQYIPTPSYLNSPWTAYNSIPDYGGLRNIPDYSSYAYLSNNIPNYGYYNQNLNRAFQSNFDNQRLALDAAHKAFDLTSNQAGYSPNSNPSRFSPFNGLPRFPQGSPFEGGFRMPDFGPNTNGAFAGAAVGPGYNHQVAAINPANPNSPNIYKSTRDSSSPGGYKSVSTSAFSSSSNMNGRKTSSQGSDTRVDNNGQVTSYSVRSP